MRLLWIGLLASGCVEQQVERADTPEPSSTSPYWGPSNVYDEEGQCHDLLGPVADTLTDREGGQTYVSFPLETTGGEAVATYPTGLAIASGSLQGKELKTGTNNVSVRFLGVGSDGTRDTYTLQYRTATDPTWRLYCPPGEQATALRGEWKASAFRVAADRVTFGCTNSAMRKCITWNYVPPHKIDPNNPATTIAWRAHQACTRMARADICGTGEPGTRKETPIVIRDYLAGYHPPPQSMPGDPLPTGVYPIEHAATYPAPPDFHFYESAWTWKEDQGAICLERDRWASVGPLTCPNLKNPFLDKSGLFCSELEHMADNSREIIDRGGILLNASKTQDRKIYLWRNPTTGDTVSTIRGFWREDHGDPIPFQGYTEYVAEDGILLRNPPYSLTYADVTPVFSALAGPNDRALLPMLGLTD
jgi:hypothetical protein